MASIYLRHRTWWVKFQHPATKQIVRANLETHDPARAQLLRRRIELEAALQEPRIRSAETPTAVREALGLQAVAEPHPVVLVNAATEVPPVSPAAGRSRIDEALKAYVEFIRAENVAHHVAGKLSMLRRFFGSQRISSLLPPVADSSPRRTKGPNHPAFFDGVFVDEIQSSKVFAFLQQLSVTKKTKRHYRELFHHFFEFCLKLGLYKSENAHCPNPIGALPSYVSKNQHIIFLSQDQINEQFRALAAFPKLRIAVALMIYAGLRRAETMWTTRETISRDGTYLSIVNRVDCEQDIESSLKTGQRSVTISPFLKEMLESYCSSLKGSWLVPTSKGRLWTGDAFADDLREINRAAGLKWTCLHYRHTFATHCAAEGWTALRIAREMGNSVAVVEQYYAGYIRPENHPPPSHSDPRPPLVSASVLSSESSSR